MCEDFTPAILVAVNAAIYTHIEKPFDSIKVYSAVENTPKVFNATVMF